MSAKWSSSDAVQARILDAAMRAFIDRGYAQTKLTDVVESAGISIGSIYHHVGGKEDLFLACHGRLWDTIQVSAGIDPERPCPDHDGWEERYLRVVRTQRAASRVFLSLDAPPRFRFVDVLSRHYANMPDYAARLLAATLLEAMRIICEVSDLQFETVLGSIVKLLKVVRAVGF